MQRVILITIDNALEAEVVGEIGADAERRVHPAAEVLEQPDRQRHVEAVGEHHRLGVRIDPHLLVVRDQLLAPFERIAGVVAHAVEQLAEEEVEVAQEGVHPADVGQRDPEVAAVLARPRVEREHLRVAQPRTDGLARLQVLVRHRAQRRQPHCHREPHVAGADELLADAGASVRTTSSCHAREKRRRVP